MEGLLTALQGFDWSSIAKPAELGLTGMGLIGNLLTQKQRSDELNYVKNQQAALQDPTKLAQMVASATQPLNRALTQEVGNVVSGSLAEQGLSQAPGIQATALSQALAPFQQQNQQTALQLVMERLGLPLQYASTYLQGLPGGVSLAPLLALLQYKPGQTPNSSTVLPPGFFAGLGKSPTIPVGGDYANQGPQMGPSDMLPPDFSGMGGWTGDMTLPNTSAVAA